MTDKAINTKDLLHAIREIPPSLLSAIEKHILTIILSCLNTKGETWHGIEYLARFSCLSIRSLNRHIKKIEEKRFIHIKRPAHYTHKVTNHYRLNQELIMTFHVNNSINVDKSGVRLTPDIQVGCQAVTPSGVRLSPHRVSRWRIKGERKKERKRERGNALPISENFFPKSETIEAIKAFGLSKEDNNDITNDFVDYYLENQVTSDDWDRMLLIWFKREIEFRKEREEKKRLNEPEERPWYHKETEHMQRGNGMAALGKILEKCKTNGQGGHDDGLGGEGKGKN